MLKDGQEPIPGYRLEKFLGRGQFGEVWRASSPGGTHVALKFLNVQERQGRKEFRAIQRIKDVRHPHLVQTYALWLLDDQNQVIDDAGFENASPMILDSVRATMFVNTMHTESSLKPSMLVIATVLCEQNLMERLQDWRERGQSGIPIPELIGYMEDAAKAIDFLNAPRHELGEGPVAIHHCDIKPENIMILGDLAVVGDFGVARILRSDGNEARSTTMGGSIAYAPPESFDNKTESTSDQYALAITYYELRTGKLPFRDESPASVMRDKRLGKLDFSAVNPREQKVLEAATSVQPTRRYPTARQFVDALHNAALNRAAPKKQSSANVVWWAIPLMLVAGVAIYVWKSSGDLMVVKPDPQQAAKQFDAALAMARKSPYSKSSLRQATEEAVKSIQAGYDPTMPEAIGNVSIGINAFDDEALGLVAIHPDGSTFVAGHDQQLDFFRLDGSERTTVKLNEMADSRLTRLIWLNDKIVFQDDRDRILFVSIADPPAADTQAQSKLVVEQQERSFASWATSDFRDGLLLLKGQKGQSEGGFKLKPGKFEMEWWSDVDSVGKSSKRASMELSTETIAHGSKDGQKFVVVSQDRSRLVTCKAWNRSDDKVVDLKSAMSKELSNIHAIHFLEDGERFVVAGDATSGKQLAVLVFVHVDNQWSVEQSAQFANDSMSRVLLVDEGPAFFVVSGTKVDVWSRGGSGGWVIDELVQFGDSLNDGLADTLGSAKTVKSLCPHLSGWLLSGHEDGKIMFIQRGSADVKAWFEIVRMESEVERLAVLKDWLLVLTKDGTVAWYDLRECLLIAEACAQTGKVSKPVTLTPPVSQ